MGFGTDFQGKSSHESLVHIQEQEIKLLENMKRCLNVRIKSDRSYADSLASLVKEAQKFSCPDYQPFCVVFQAWETIVQQTDRFVQYLNHNVTELTSETLTSLNDLINEKKAAKKFYLDERIRLEQEFSKVQDDVQKNKQEYSKSLVRLSQDEAKYNDSKTKGKQAKIEEAKSKYQRSASKLHKIHNDYVISLKAVVTHQKCYLHDTMPAFLDYHQTAQEILVQQCKEMLQQFQRLTDFSNEECCDIYKSIEQAIEEINPEKEYSSQSFIDKFSTPPIEPMPFDFGNSLLADYQGRKLIENELSVDDLTHSDLVTKKGDVEQEINRLQLLLKNKEDALQAVKDDMTKIDSTQWQQKEHQDMRKSIDKLRCEVLEAKGKLTVQKDLLTFISSALDGVGNSVPAALDFAAIDNAEKTEDNNTSASAPSPTSSKLRFKLSMPHFKTKERPIPEKDDTRQSYDETSVGSAGSNGPKMSPVPKKENQYPTNNSSDLPLEEEEWFHGVLPREEVQRLLCNNGDYLVRESKNRKTNEPQYVLSAFWDGHKHFIIQFGETGWRFEGETFPTISALVLYQHNSGLPVTSRSQAILKNPIIREQWQLRNDDIALEVKIGNGNFGEVYKGSYKPKNMIVAVKTCKDTLSEDQRRKFLQEGRILKQYDHPNIVRFIGIAAQRQPVMIVMEYVAGGALLSYLRKHGKSQSKKQLSKMCEDAANGMAYLESKNCIHRDLAARNCLVGDKQVVKISDFGMSREEEEYTVSDGLKQIPIKWTAPEALMYGKYTSLCDVWSFGILMWEIFSGGITPYQGMTNNQAREKIDAGYRMPSPDGTPADCYGLMMKCWEYNPNKRIHFDAILKELQSIVKKL